MSHGSPPSSATPRALRFTVLPGEFAVVRFGARDAVPPWALAGDAFMSATRTDDEISVVCQQAHVPPDVRAERGWAIVKLLGPFPFDAVGVLASCAQPLAEAGVSVFALSTFETDYILVKQAQRSVAIAALTRAGHREVTA